MLLIFANDQEAATALRAAGLKATPQRMAILRSLGGDETHPTAQELYERLRVDFPGLSVATVYNTLSALTRVGSCRPLELGGPVRFDPNVSAHDHALCDRCGAIRDVSAATAPADSTAAQHPALYQDTLRALDGFRVQRVERIYRGLCASCVHAHKVTHAAQHE